MASRRIRGPLIAGVATAVGASVCCVGPLLLLALGVSGAWIADLTVLEPLRPMFVAAALLFLALAFRRLYAASPRCAPEAACAREDGRTRQRFLFWVVAVSVIGLLAAPWAAPLFY